jgi:hypothetical protein
MPWQSCLTAKALKLSRPNTSPLAGDVAMSQSLLPKVGPNSQQEDPVESVKTNTDQIQEAENEGLAPIVPSNPAVHQEIDPAS